MRSVILAAYEGARYIGAQIDSIMEQLAGDDELIVSDDASTDATVSTVLQRKDPRIRVVENRARVGYVKNFERAIEQARGEHVFFSDQDDVWLPHKVSTVCAALERKHCVVSDAVIVDQDLRQLHPSYFEWRGAKSFGFLPIFVRPCLIGATMACRRDYLETMIPFHALVPHDFWIALNAAWDGELEVIESPLILYRRHASTASVSATTNKRPLSTILTERLSLIGHLVVDRLSRSGPRDGARPQGDADARGRERTP
jgi:glycosyltransferase involved in cell wall biosynthesis